MTALVLVLDAPTADHLSRAIAAYLYRARRPPDDVIAALEQVRCALSPANPRQSRTSAARPPDNAHDGRMSQLCVSYATAAEALDVSERQVQRLVKAGSLPVVALGGARRIPVAALRQLVDPSRGTNGRLTRTVVASTPGPTDALSETTVVATSADGATTVVAT